MTTLDFARAHVRFDKSSPITGPFRDEFYPFLRKPFEAADDIRVKRLVIFKASSCMGTVAGQIINAKRIACDVGDQIMVCQTDEKAEQWTKTRGKEFLGSIPAVQRLLSRDKYSVTNSLWLFRHKWLMIGGPGINRAQSDQCRFLQTDESHLEAYGPGCLTEWEKRMGGRWDRQATHITTAPDKGKEVDGFFEEGQQDEFHFRCPKCNGLVWPMWFDDSKEHYNGHIVFPLFRDAVLFDCPHCHKASNDTARERYSLVKDGDYVAQNPSAPIETRSFRWNVFAAHWISWRDTYIESAAADKVANDFGDLKPLEDFTKKRLCKSWVPILPFFGEGAGKGDYKLGDVWGCDDSIRVLTSDPQAGKADEGAHFRALVTEWRRDGASRRIAAERIETFGQLDAIQAQHRVEDRHVMVDSGWENRLIYRECGKRHWFCFRGSDATEFLHTEGEGEHRITHPMPYSQREPASGIVGEKQPKRLRAVREGSLPRGWAWVIVGANPTLYGYLSALLGGGSGRYFGVASDFNPEYRETMPAFIAFNELDKKTNIPKKIAWKKVRADHWWDCEVMALVVAMRNGYFPLAIPQPVPIQDEIPA